MNSCDENGGCVAQWLYRRTGDRVILGLNPAAATSLWNFGTFVYPALPVFFGGDSKIRCSFLPGVYAMGRRSIRTHTH